MPTVIIDKFLLVSKKTFSIFDVATAFADITPIQAYDKASCLYTSKGVTILSPVSFDKVSKSTEEDKELQ